MNPEHRSLPPALLRYSMIEDVLSSSVILPKFHGDRGSCVFLLTAVAGVGGRAGNGDRRSSIPRSPFRSSSCTRAARSRWRRRQSRLSDAESARYQSSLQRLRVSSVKDWSFVCCRPAITLCRCSLSSGSAGRVGRAGRRGTLSIRVGHQDLGYGLRQPRRCAPDLGDCHRARLRSTGEGGARGSGGVHIQARLWPAPSISRSVRTLGLRTAVAAVYAGSSRRRRRPASSADLPVRLAAGNLPASAPSWPGWSARRTVRPGRTHTRTRRSALPVEPHRGPPFVSLPAGRGIPVPVGTVARSAPPAGALPPLARVPCRGRRVCGRLSPVPW